MENIENLFRYTSIMDTSVNVISPFRGVGSPIGYHPEPLSPTTPVTVRGPDKMSGVSGPVSTPTTLSGQVIYVTVSPVSTRASLTTAVLLCLVLLSLIGPPPLFFRFSPTTSGRSRGSDVLVELTSLGPSVSSGSCATLQRLYLE